MSDPASSSLRSTEPDSPSPGSSDHVRDDDDVTLASLELSSEFRKVLDNINRLGDAGTETVRAGDETDDVSPTSTDDVETMTSEADIVQQVRRDEVTYSSQRDVSHGQDAQATEQNERTGGTDADDISYQQSDDTADALTDNDMKLNAEVLISAENGPAVYSERKLNVEEPSQSSPQDVVNRSGHGRAAKCRCSTDMEDPFQHQAGASDHRSPDAGATCRRCIRRSASSFQATVDEQSSASPMYDSPPDVESNASECIHECSSSRDDSSCSSEAEELNGTDGIKPVTTETSRNGSREISKAKLEIVVDEQQSNEDVAETSTVQTYSAAEAERTSLHAAGDDGCSVSSKGLYRGSESNRQVTEFFPDDSGERSRDLDDAGVFDGVEDATRSEKMSSSNSSGRVHTLSNINTVIFDAKGFDHNDRASEVSCLLGQTGRTLSSSSSSSSSFSSMSSATAQPNLLDADQTPTAACKDARPTQSDAEMAPRLPSSGPLSQSPPISLESSAVYSRLENGSGSEEYRLGRWDRKVESVRDDVALSETYAQSSPLPVSLPSSPLSSSSSTSSFLVGNHRIRSSESQRSESAAEYRYEVDSMSERQINRCNSFRDEDPPVSSFSAALYQADVTRDPSTAANIKDTTDRNLTENCLVVSQTSNDPQRTSDVKTALAEQSELTAVTTTDPTESEPRTVESLDRNADGVLDSTFGMQNSFSPESTMSEDEQLETRAQQTEGGQNNVDVGEERPGTERDVAMRRTEFEDLAPTPLTQPPSQFMKQSFPGGYLNRDVDDISRLGGNATNTDNENVKNSRETFTSVSTLYIQPSAGKDNMTACTSNDSNTSNARTVTTLPEDRRLQDSSAENGRFLDTFNGSSAASRRTNDPEYCEVVTSKSDHHETEECRSIAVEVEEDDLMSASNGVNGIIPIEALNRAKSPLATVVDDDSKVFTRRSENRYDDLKGAPVRNYTNSSRSSAPPTAIKRITPTRLAASGNDSGGFVGTAAESATTVDALDKRERGSTVDRVSFRSSEMNCGEKSKGIGSGRKTGQLHVLTATGDNGEDEKERARRLLQSVLMPVCRNAGLSSRAPKPPAVNRNKVNAGMAAELTESWQSPPSDDVVRDFRLLSTRDERTGQLARRPAPCLLTGSIRHPTVASPQPRAFRDSNNNNNNINNKQTADRDVIKTVSPTTRRSRGDKPSSSQQKQVLYDVTTTLPRSQRTLEHRSMGHADQNSQRRLTKQLSEDASRPNYPTERAAVLCRRSLSLPVIDRSEAFIVWSATATERNRVRLPRTARRSPPPLPPTRFKSPRPGLTVVREYRRLFSE